MIKIRIFKVINLGYLNAQKPIQMKIERIEIIGQQLRLAEVDGASTGNDERLFRRLEMCNDRAQTELMMRRARMKTEKIL